ncbi:hypothetical protein ABW19_dt0200721 [Dactylella cylindrospora]|nr:hypothetical protein ABW19_dt0200721 [Dactylella cylindrospora]
MTRTGGRHHAPVPHIRNPNMGPPEIPIPPHLYPFCTRMKQTPIRSSLMSHGCCFDYFEKGYCMAGNECKYSHLKPGDERNLIMDSEFGLRRKKYYRPETLETYLPGSQDVICFTFARKGWCIHGDKCWNQHIAPPLEILQDTLVNMNGLSISKTPSPVQNKMPTVDTGFGMIQRIPTPPVHGINQQRQQWSASTLMSTNRDASEHLRAAAGKSTCKMHYKLNPKRADAPNWRVPSDNGKSVAADEAQPVRPALEFNWKPVINTACNYKWTQDPKVGKDLTHGAAASTRDTFGPDVNYNLLIDFSEDEFEDRKYRFHDTNGSAYLA